MAAPLTAELGLGAGDLGLLTSVYFVTFAVAQIPIGILLDRYGPRRIQSVLLVVAATGSALFAMSNHFLGLLAGRALIGLGVAAALTAGLKALVLWFPRERVPLLNGLMVMLGALGAVTATLPADLLLVWIGWRYLFGLFAALTAACAVMVYMVVPEAAPIVKGAVSVGLKRIYADPRFWRLAPLSASCIGTAWSLQGLWAAQWFSDVDGLDRGGVVQQLFVMAVALSLGAIVLGVAADRLRRRGVGPEMLLALVASVFISAQLALILRLPLPSFFLWAVVAAVGAATVVSFAILTEYFPKELAGRANGALKSVPHCSSIRRAIRDRNSTCSMDASGRALSRNRLSDRFCHQSRAPDRGVDLVCAAALLPSIVGGARLTTVRIVAHRRRPHARQETALALGQDSA